MTRQPGLGRPNLGAMFGRGRSIAVVALISLAVIGPQASPPLMSTHRLGFGRAASIGATAPNENLSFEVSLNLADRAALHRSAESIGDGAGGPVLTASEIGAHYGLSGSDIDRVVRWLRRGGLTQITPYPQRTAISVTGSARTVDRLFHTRLVDSRDPQSGLVFHRPAVAPRIPSGLRAFVSGIVGLDNRPLTRLDRTVSARSRGGPVGCPDCITPSESATAFDFASLHDQGIRGEGETVAVVMDGRVAPSDITTWAKNTGVTGVHPFQVIKVGSGPSTAEQTSSDAVDEGTLDVEQVLGVAPHAQVLYYLAPLTLGAFGAALNKIVSDGRAKIVTFSAGGCDADNVSDPDLVELRNAETDDLDAAVVAGVNVFVASGDSGAFGCNPFDPDRMWQPDTGWPDDSADVISVGGTYLERAADGTYVSEEAWGQPTDGSGSGGGLSPVDPRPSWQTGPGVVNDSSNGKRQEPDVAAPADPVSAWYTVVHGRGTGAGGTSAASPFWAGVAALVQQSLSTAGLGRLGFLPPQLYSIAASEPPGGAFHDVTTGNNLYYRATPGWDFATGLGSPDVANLATAVANSHRQHSG